MKTILFIAFTFLIDIFFSQNLEWVKKIGNNNITQASSITSDYQGNLFCIGYHTEIIDFNPNSGISNLSPGHLFIAKYGLSSNILWAKTIPKLVNSYLNANVYEIKSATDEAGNLYIASTFRGTIDFDPGPAENLLYGSTQIDVNKKDFFILKLSPNGNFIWVKHLLGNLDPDFFDFELKDNKLYLATSLMGTIDLDPSTAEVSLSTENYKNDMFIASYDLDGSYIGHRVFVNLNFDDILSDMTIGSNGAIYIIGSFHGLSHFPNFDGTVTTFNIGEMGYDNFLLKISSLTEGYGCDWVKQLPSEDFSSNLKLLAKSNDELLLYGEAYDPLSLDFNDSVNSLIPIAVPFFANYNSNGDLLSFHKFPQRGNQNYITLLNAFEDNEQNLFFSGMHRGTVDLDFGPSEILSQSDSSNLILVKYDGNAQYLWQGIIQNKSNYVLSFPLSIYNTTSESIYLTASFNGICDFDPNLQEINIAPSHIWPLGGIPFNKDMAMVRLNNLPSLESLSIQEQLQVFTIYPNPVEFTLKFENLEKPSSFVISDILGNTISQGEINPSYPEIDIQNIVKGVYILKIENYIQSKFIKN